MSKALIIGEVTDNAFFTLKTLSAELNFHKGQVFLEKTKWIQVLLDSEVYYIAKQTMVNWVSQDSLKTIVGKDINFRGTNYTNVMLTNEQWDAFIQAAIDRDYTDTDLQTDDNAYLGAGSWVLDSGTIRGLQGMMKTTAVNSSVVDSSYGWRPILKINTKNL